LARPTGLAVQHPQRSAGGLDGIVLGVASGLGLLLGGQFGRPLLSAPLEDLGVIDGQPAQIARAMVTGEDGRSLGVEGDVVLRTRPRREAPSSRYGTWTASSTSSNGTVTTEAGALYEDVADLLG